MKVTDVDRLTKRLLLVSAILMCDAVAGRASSISIFAQGSGLTGVNSQISNPSNGQELIYHQIVGGISSTSLYSMTEIFLDASPGILRAGVAAFAGNPDRNRFAGSGASGSFSASSNDTVFLNGAPATGFFSLQVKMEGSIRLDALFTAGPGQPMTADAEWKMDLNVANTRMLAIRDGATVGPADEVSVAHDIAQIATLLIPYSGTSLQLLETISSGSYSCSATRLEFCSSTGFFESSFQLGGGVILDAAGNVAPGATFTSQTGYDYSQALNLSGAPEPATWLLVGVALGFRVISARVRRRRPRELNRPSL
jgi:hypothetical protein